MQDISIIGIIVAVVVLVILLFMAIGYVKAPPDMARQQPPAEFTCLRGQEFGQAIHLR